MEATRREALNEIEAERLAVAENHTSDGGGCSGAEQEMTAIANLMIAELQEAEFDLCRPVFCNEEHERTDPPLGAFRVLRRRKGRGIRIEEYCTSASCPSVWIESRAAARLFRKHDVFFLGWGGGKCHFLPPTRKSWRDSLLLPVPVWLVGMQKQGGGLPVEDQRSGGTVQVGELGAVGWGDLERARVVH